MKKVLFMFLLVFACLFNIQAQNTKFQGCIVLPGAEDFFDYVDTGAVFGSARPIFVTDYTGAFVSCDSLEKFKPQELLYLVSGLLLDTTDNEESISSQEVNLFFTKTPEGVIVVKVFKMAKDREGPWYISTQKIEPATYVANARVYEPS